MSVLSRVWKSPVAMSTAWHETLGCARYTVCTTHVPSVVANDFSSRRKNMLEFTNPAPLPPGLSTLSAASLACNSSATCSSIGTSNGSMRALERHVPLGVGETGASVTGRRCATRLAFACATASFAVRATSSRVRSLVAANPHDPPTSTRMPMPNVSLSPRPSTRVSRVLMLRTLLRLILASA